MNIEDRINDFVSEEEKHEITIAFSQFDIQEAG